jgi:hypothetical protein
MNVASGFFNSALGGVSVAANSGVSIGTAGGAGGAP